jgi:hypothetical protein
MSSFSFPNLSEYLDSVHDALPPYLQAYFTRQNIQLLIRVVVIISTYTLFRPHLESLFRKATGAPDRREEEIKARMASLKQQREGGGAGSSASPRGAAAGAGVGVGMVGQQGTVYRVVSPTQGAAGTTKGKTKGGKRKA